MKTNWKDLPEDVRVAVKEILSKLNLADCCMQSPELVPNERTAKTAIREAIVMINNLIAGGPVIGCRVCPYEGQKPCIHCDNCEYR